MKKNSQYIKINKSANIKALPYFYNTKIQVFY